MSLEIEAKLDAIERRIRAACKKFGRARETVTLVCVSKTAPSSAIDSAIEAGQRHFGENYADEAIAKIPQLASNSESIWWHFLGSVQSNKIGTIARTFDWVHGVDSTKIARLLGQQRSSELARLQVCVQVNLSEEASKRGTSIRALPAVIQEVLAQPRLELRGLMSIPPATQDLALQHGFHRQLREAFEELQGQGLALDTLSMGMSQDLEAAIAEGSTMVRVGTAIFGARPPKQD